MRRDSGCRPAPRTATATYYLSVNRSKRAVTLDLHRPRRPGHCSSPRGAGRCRRSRTSSPAGSSASTSTTTTVRAAEPARRLRIDQRVRTRFRPARLRRPRPGAVRTHERDRVAGRRADARPASRSSTSSPACTRRSGVLAALRHRDVTGEGQRVEVNLLSVPRCRRSSISPARSRSAGVVPQRLGNDHPSIFPLRCRSPPPTVTS